MTVKRWSVGVDGPDENGNLVAYADYLSLAAENSSLRLTIDNIVNALGLGDGPVSQQVIEIVNGLVAENAALKEYLAPLGMTIEGTKSTDAAIAEIKAQGIDWLISIAEPVWLECYLKDAERLADTLRTGGKAS